METWLAKNFIGGVELTQPFYHEVKLKTKNMLASEISRFANQFNLEFISTSSDYNDGVVIIFREK